MRVVSVTQLEDRLGVEWDHVEWDHGSRAEYHYLWLRDNCPCEECRHPDAWERTLDHLDLPLDLASAAAEGGDDVTITWQDGHSTVFSAGWLYDHAYEPSARAKRRQPPVLWTAASISNELPESMYREVMETDGGLLGWLQQINRYGFSIVRDVPKEVGAVTRLAERIAFVQETNFGRSFQVISKPDPENLAYTAVKLNPHNDVVNRWGLPGLQLLHCIEFEAEGGESILVDGYEAADRLRTNHPDDFELLASVTVPYRFQDADTDILNRVRVIGVDRDGHYTEIRYHNALLAPLDLDPDLVIPFYRAFQRFGRILRDPDLELVFKMRPGDCQVFDNRRVLHARAEFDPNSGPRHLQGCYVDRDDFVSRLRVLQRHGADFRRS